MTHHAHDFKAALKALENETYENLDQGETVDCISVIGQRHCQAIRRALLIADALMKEPSAKTRHIGGEYLRELFGDEYSNRLSHQTWSSELFKLMTEQLLKEIVE